METGETTSYMPGQQVEVSSDTWAYRPAQDFNGNVEFSYKVTDGASTPTDATATLTVMAQDDDPELTVPTGSVSASEGQAKFIDGITISDVDVEDANQQLAVILTVTDGTLRVGEQEGSTVTLYGTKDYINAELSGAGRLYHEDSDSDGPTRCRAKWVMRAVP